MAVGSSLATPCNLLNPVTSSFSADRNTPTASFPIGVGPAESTPLGSSSRPARRPGRYLAQTSYRGERDLVFGPESAQLAGPLYKLDTRRGAPPSRRPSPPDHSTTPFLPNAALLMKPRPPRIRRPARDLWTSNVCDGGSFPSCLPKDVGRCSAVSRSRHAGLCATNLRTPTARPRAESPED